MTGPCVDPCGVEVPEVPLCGHHQQVLRRMIEQAPAVYAQLGDQLVPQRTGPTSEAVSGGGGISKPLPISDQVAEHRMQLLHDVRWWARWALDQVGVTLLHVDERTEVTTACAILRAALWLPEHEDAPVLLDILTAWHRRARQLCDLPRLRAQLDVATHGMMPTDVDPDVRAEWGCDGIVRALIPADKAALVMLDCRACGTRWDITDLPESQRMRLAVSEAARLVGVHRDTIYRWVKAGKVRLPVDGRVRLDQVLCVLSAQ